MKKITAICLVMILTLSLSFTCFAAELNGSTPSGDTAISVSVPNSHKITIKTDGNGTVNYNGVTVTEIDAERLSTPRVLIMGNSGYTIEKVMLGDADITAKVVGGYYTFDKVYQDEIMNITFKKVENGTYLYTVAGTVTKGGKPVDGVELELHSDIKTTVTNGEGKFIFQKVEEGHHTLTATQNGKVVGYTEFYLTQSDATQNVDIEKNADGTFTVFVGKNFSIVELNFNLKDDGTLEIGGGKATNNPSDIKDYPNAPQTGDNSNMMVWVVMLMASLAVLIVCYSIKTRIKKTTNC